MANTKPEKLYWTAAEVAKKIYGGNLSSVSILKMIHAGEIPSVRMTRKYYIPNWWVQKQIEYATVEPCSENAAAASL